MLTFKDLAARFVGRAVDQLQADLRAGNYPQADPIPMEEWLKQLEARAAAEIERIEAAPPPDDDDDDPDYEDFDLRR